MSPRTPIPAPRAPLAEIAAAADRDPAVARAIPPAGRGWAIAPDVARLLAGLILELPIRSVLEVGAGRSSLVAAAALAAKGGGRLTSVEQDPSWCAELWREVTATPGMDARLVAAAPHLTAERRGVFYELACERELAVRGPFDLVLIDAPQYFYGREGALHAAWNKLAPGALVLLDDGGRSGERRAVRRWVATYPGLELLALDPTFGGEGVALLRFSGADADRVRPGVLLGDAVSALERWWRWRGVRRRWEKRLAALSGERPPSPPSPSDT